MNEGNWKGGEWYDNAGKNAGECTRKAQLRQRGNGSYSMRGELRRGISLNKRYLNRKVRHSGKEALKRGDYRRICKTLHMVEFS